MLRSHHQMAKKLQTAKNGSHMHRKVETMFVTIVITSWTSIMSYVALIKQSEAII